MKKINTLVLFALGFVSLFAQEDALTPGGRAYKAPIDTNAIILVAVAVLLTVGVVAYKKLNFKKA